jgi:hypothetical protein
LPVRRSEEGDRVMRENCSFSRVKFYSCLAIISLFLLGGSAQADLLQLTLQPTPDIAVFSIDFAYNASSHTLSASGTSTCISTGSPDDPVVFDESSLQNGTFLLSTTVDNAGIASAGSLTIGGSVLGYGSTGPLLTANNLSYFNSLFVDTLNPNSDVADFEFIFDISGGEMANMFGGTGAKIGIILTWVSTAGDAAQNQFTTNFDNLNGHNFGEGWGTAMADTAPIPEPATLSLLAFGAAALLRRRKS